MFIDYAKIFVKAGHGGSGCVSFHREKFIDKGGPDGGDGGRGGSVIIYGVRQLRTLKDYSYRKEYLAKRGQHGKGSNCHGKGAVDVELKVPLGTIIKDVKTGEIIADITEDNQKYIVARGGRGGRGNARFATSTHRSPREWEVGNLGQERMIELELKMIADIGLVGLPNAGKSTLLSRISAARPKIADYPFTTLQPNLGIVEYYEYNTFVVADIPGLIEGAHKGKGLGHQFLRHIERTRALAYVIDITEDDPLEVYRTLQTELKSFSAILTKKPVIVVLTKTDLNIEENIIDDEIFNSPVIRTSAVTGEHISELKKAFYTLIQKALQLEEPCPE